MHLALHLTGLGGLPRPPHQGTVRGVGLLVWIQPMPSMLEYPLSRLGPQARFVAYRTAYVNAERTEA